MPGQDILISDFDIGLENDKEPFLLPEKAFSNLENATVFRGRVEKKQGFVNQGRLRRVIPATALITTTTAAGPQTTVPDLLADGAVNLRAIEPNAEIQPGSVVVTVADGFGSAWNDATTNGTLTSTGGNAIAGTINYVTGQLILNFNPNDVGGNVITVTFNYYPSFPVMGLRTRKQSSINREQTIAFDTRYSYRFQTPGGWEELPSAVATTWNGDNAEFFWTTNYRGTTPSQQLFWVTNFNQSNGGGDPISHYDGATWTTFNPIIKNTGVPRLQQCKILLSFNNRLLALNTWEGATLAGATNFKNRVRFSQNGDPTVIGSVGPYVPGSFADDIVGKGGFINATTSEAIIGAQFVQNRLIVFFESSTWELVSTGNRLVPFLWQQINTELGSESTFSEVGFDEGVLGVGNTGIHLANTSSVKRIDEQIPEEIGKINNSNDGPARVYGIRDFDKELIYWTYPDQTGSPIFPNRILVYNYRNNTFAKYKDKFTCYGYFQKTTGYTWATLPFPNWGSWNIPWNSGVGQSFFLQIIAGNQQGYTSLFDGSTINDSSLSVTGISGSTITSPNHGFTQEDVDNGVFVTFQNLTGITITGIGHTTQTFKITSLPIGDPVNTFTIDGIAAGTYPGGGSLTLLSNINITTKNFDFATKIGQQNFLNHIEVLFSKTSQGEVTLDLFQDFDTSTPMESLWGTNTVRTRPENGDNFALNQNKIWHKIPRNIIADNFQIKISLSDDQMRSEGIQTSNVVLHALLLNIEATGRLK